MATGTSIANPGAMPRGGRPLRSIYHRSIVYWPSIIPVLMIRDVDRRFRNSNMAGLILVLEPIMLMGAMAALRWFMSNGLPIYGPSMALFLVSGVLPFYLFVHASRGLSKDVSNEREYPIVNDLDIQFARLLIEAVRNVFLTAALLTAIYVFDTAMACPHDLANVFFGTTLIMAFALSLGLINSAIVTVFPAWTFFNRVVSRFFFFGSGVFSITDQAMPHVKDLVVWNPIGHCIMIIRLGYYPDYPHNTLDVGYVVMFASALLFIGFSAFAARPRD